MLLQCSFFTLLVGRMGRDVAKNNRREKRNEQIRSEYQTQFAAGLRSEVILETLARRWYLAPDTLERIVFQRGRYRDPLLMSTSNPTEA